jgi:hypothetical protein
MATLNENDYILMDKVNQWAKDNATDDFYYGSRQSYWAAALANKFITVEEYEHGQQIYGHIWTYRGD